jgi:hypothetical protein
VDYVEIDSLITRLCAEMIVNATASETVVPEFTRTGRALDAAEVIRLLQGPEIPRSVGAWVALLHDEPEVTAAVLTSLETSLGARSSPPLAVAAVVLAGTDALPALAAYATADKQNGWRACAFIAAAAEHLGGSVCCSPTDSTRGTFARFLSVAEHLRTSPDLPLSMRRIAPNEPVVKRLAAHESGVRRMAADGRGEQYRAFGSLTEAQADNDGIVVLEGDYGGQIYVVFVASEVRCTEASLARLLSDLDAIAWPCNNTDGASVFYEQLSVGSGVSGGMGGGVVVAGGWVHPRLREQNLDQQIREVIAGQRTAIESLPNQPFLPHWLGISLERPRNDAQSTWQTHVLWRTTARNANLLNRTSW